MTKNPKFNFKVLSVHTNYLLASCGYRINRYSLDGKWIEYMGTLTDTGYGRWAEYKLTRRLLRAEITSLYELYDGAMIAIAKKGIFRKEKDEHEFHKVFTPPRGSKPLNICFTPNGHAFFGEYFQNLEKTAVNVYGSEDCGKSWKVIYTFDTGSINHVHGIYYDYFTNRMWVVTGDRENECIIGWTEDEFKTFHVEFRGGQEYRSCQLFFYENFIVYATDSQYVENEIRAINRKTLEIVFLQKLQGSVIKGGQCGEVSYLSTTVEPSIVNKDKKTHVWVSLGGLEWHEVFEDEKDFWPPILQYGTFEFPIYHDFNNRLYFCGRAVKGYDAKTSFVVL